jgi:hypothetical protein
MKYLQTKRILPLIGIFGIFLILSCNDEWKEHYDQDSFNLPDKTIYTCIQEYPELSTFTKMLASTGYDKILNSSQSFTVWAPNNDALSGVDTTDKDLVLKIVTNHIARSRFTTSGSAIQSIRMLDKKFIEITKEGDNYKFGNYNMVKSNLNTKNGLVHEIDGYVPYLKNLWEYLGTTDGLDSISSYLYNQSDSVFDPDNSIEIGVNDQGQTIYSDSAYIVVNPILTKIGDISYEDSIFTAIMPNNQAWNEAYGRIEKYYNFPDDGGSVLRKREMTQFTIVKDMLYHGRIDNSQTYDSLVTTTGNVYYNPGQLFTNIESNEALSNGISYVTSQMPFNDTLSWFKEIRVEAEETEGRTNEKNNIYTRSGYGTGYTISENEYIKISPITEGSSVEFSIPNTLSAKYNIYCVFVPTSITDPNIQVSTKATFQLTFINRQTGGTFVKDITPANNITLPNAITKMLITQYSFQFANVIDDAHETIKVKLKVTNKVKTDEEVSGQFTRTMLIDCIILEPVLE